MKKIIYIILASFMLFSCVQNNKKVTISSKEGIEETQKLFEDKYKEEVIVSASFKLENNSETLEAISCEVVKDKSIFISSYLCLLDKKVDGDKPISTEIPPKTFKASELNLQEILEYQKKISVMITEKDNNFKNFVVRDCRYAINEKGEMETYLTIVCENEKHTYYGKRKGNSKFLEFSFKADSKKNLTTNGLNL